MSAVRFTIGELASRTGLSTHTIRAWEKRYSAITPERTGSNQRLYDSAQLERLRLLRRATQNSHPISRVANLPDQELASLAIGDQGVGVSSPSGQDLDLLQESLAAIERLDDESLLHFLKRSLAILGIEGVLDTLLIPLLSEIGNRWQGGSMHIYQEHMATSVIRGFLAVLLSSMNPQIESPRILVTTPKNQIHEIGALLAAIACASEGWNVVYLGPNLPSKEIADAAARSHANAIGLSIVYPHDDPLLAEELGVLRHLVGASKPIMVGGSGAGSYEKALSNINAVMFSDWKSVGTSLRSLTIS